MSEPLRCTGCGALLVVAGQRPDVIRCEYCGADNVLAAEARTIVAQDSRPFLVKLYRAIARDFDLDGIQDLVKRLNGRLPASYDLDYENLPGTGDVGKARELVQWCRRRKCLQTLVDTVLSVRPSIDLS